MGGNGKQAPGGDPGPAGPTAPRPQGASGADGYTRGKARVVEVGGRPEDRSDGLDVPPALGEDSTWQRGQGPSVDDNFGRPEPPNKEKHGNSTTTSRA